MNPEAERQPPWPPMLVWWVVWFGLLAGFLQVWHFGSSLPPAKATPTLDLLAALVGAGALIVSAAIRWLLLPRIGRARVAFILFIVGQALAEAGGYCGIFLGGARRDLLALAGLLGLLQFLPRLARRFWMAPARRR